MNDGQLRTLIHKAKTMCLPHHTPVEVLLWALATELEKRMPPETGGQAETRKASDWSAA